MPAAVAGHEPAPVARGGEVTTPTTREHRLRYIEYLKKASDGLLFGAVFLLVIVLGPMLGEFVEGYYLPVMKDASIEITGRTPDGNLIVTLYVDKVRGHCRIVDLTAMVRKDKIWYRARVFSADYKPIVPATRPPGYQRFDPWIVHPSGDRMRVVIRHDCHPLWETVTVLGDWPTPQLPPQLLEQQSDTRK